MTASSQESASPSGQARRHQTGLRRRAAVVSLGVAVALLAIKGAAWFITGSAAILSDALESVTHLGAVGFMYWAVRFASAPPDADHPYGHGKAEQLSIGFEGGAIVLAALVIAVQAVESLVRGVGPASLDLGLILIGIAAVVNLILGLWLQLVGRRLDAPVLIADGKHVLSDVWTSIGVLVGVGVCWLLPPGPWQVGTDAGVALILAGYILWVGLGLMREAAAGLLDQADPALMAKVVAIIESLRSAEWIDVHNLRARRAGDQIHIDFHLVVPATWTVATAHDAVELLEQRLLANFSGQGSVLVHLDHDGSEPYRNASRLTGPLTVKRATRIEPPESGISAGPILP